MTEAERKMREFRPGCYLKYNPSGRFQIHRSNLSWYAGYTGYNALGIESKTKDGAWENALSLYQLGEDLLLIRVLSQ
jgi:hypothetical protein